MVINRFLSAICLSCLCISAAFAELMPDKNEKGKFGYLNEDGSVAIKYDYNEAYAFVDGRAKVRKGDKWGYIDHKGKEVIKIRYSEMGNWENGLCKVAVGGKVDDGILTGAKYGYIDASGKDVLKPQYDAIGEFIDGIAFVEKGGKYGYIKRDCSFIIPCEFDAVGAPNRIGLIWVNKGGKFKDQPAFQKLIGAKVQSASQPGVRRDMGGKYGIYNSRGEVIVPCEYKVVGAFLNDSIIRDNNLALIGKDLYDIDKFAPKAVGKYQTDTKLMRNDYRTNFYVQLAAFEMLYARDTKVYARSALNPGKMRDVVGNTLRSSGLSLTTEVSAANFNFVKFRELPCVGMLENGFGYVWASNNYDGSYPAVFDLTGKKVLEKGNYECVGIPCDLIMVVANKVGKSDMKMNYYSITNGRTILDKDFEFDAKADKESFSNMLMNFDNSIGERRKMGSVNLVSLTGSFVQSPLVFDYVSDFQNNVAIIGFKNEFGLAELNSYKTELNVLVPMSYDLIKEPSEGLIVAKKGADYGFLDMKGNNALPFKYGMATSFKNGAARVVENGKWGLIDKSGAYLVKPEWRNVLNLDTVGTKYVWVAQPADSLMYAYDIKAKKLLGGGYKSVFSYFGKEKIAYASRMSEFYKRNDSGDIVKTPMEAIGGVTPDGEVVIPFAFFYVDEAKKAYADMIKAGKTKLSATDGVRLALYASEVRNQFKLDDVIPDEMWDY